ncbi:hypothetical protein ASG87_11250 [Frateuria sp. Soil773]|uniref:EF-hand domain-containing protein n=1 Tax=Frateuria sp. Soil773 TaxID=1736407 RepID=UPI0006FFB614|nr:EF-hand domain-containing protein [Frateuria sp. Soil773]KRF02054.1 hypothetical protein ASG87_11250 [Frateuria sp. Soil773]
MKRIQWMTAALAATLAAFSASAQNGLGGLADQAARASKNFDIADKNHDGLLSREEAEAGPVPFIRAHFDAIDTAHRGQVSKADVAAYIRRMQNAGPARATTVR